LQPEEYLKPEVIKQVARLDLKARFLVEGFLAGLHSSPFKGFSVEFSEHRKYVPGDDIRSIDWKVFARTNRYYVKQYAAETNMECHLLVDCSGSMGYGYGITKLQYATYLAAALSYIMLNQQDPVGLVTFGKGLRSVMKPRAKRSHVISILRHLDSTRATGRSNVAASLHLAAEMIRHRGLVVLFSDLLDEPEQVIEGLRHLSYRGHDVIVFQILDDREVRLPFDRFSRFVDVETGEEVPADPDAVRAGYARELGAFIDGYRDACRRENIDFLQFDTATRFDAALTAYLMKRSGR